MQNAEKKYEQLEEKQPQNTTCSLIILQILYNY